MCPVKGHHFRFLNSGTSLEDTARILNKNRLDIGKRYKGITPDHLYDNVIKPRNMNEYGNEFGPTIDYLRKTKRKSWMQIIDSSSRPVGKDLGF
jgi:hypothetical protein